MDADFLKNIVVGCVWAGVALCSRWWFDEIVALRTDGVVWNNGVVWSRVCNEHEDWPETRRLRQRARPLERPNLCVATQTLLRDQHYF